MKDIDFDTVSKRYEPRRYYKHPDGGKHRGSELAEKLNMNYPGFKPISFLGLAAGYGEPELELALRLGIPDSNITFVDRGYGVGDTVAGHLSSTRPEIRLIDGGMFDFLNGSIERYDIITAIGVEYILEFQGAMEKLAEGVSKLLNPGGVIIVEPLRVIELPVKLWAAYGITPVHQKSAYPFSCMIYSLGTQD